MTWLVVIAAVWLAAFFPEWRRLQRFGPRLPIWKFFEQRKAPDLATARKIRYAELQCADCRVLNDCSASASRAGGLPRDCPFSGVSFL